MRFSPASKGRLTDRDLDRFPDRTLFHRIGRAVCHAGCLPRKELYEAWEVARRARRLFRGGRVVDFAAGHGLLAHIMLLLDDSSPTAIAVDTVDVPSRIRLQAELVRAWPRLEGRVEFMASPLESIALSSDDVIVSSHACGALSDVALDAASAVRARVAVLPCCHDRGASDTGGLSGWMDDALAIDVMRAARLKQRGYRVWTQTIPAAITPKNRILLAAPE